MRTEAHGLEGGLSRTAHERRMHPLTTALMSNYIPSEMIGEFDNAAPAGEPLTEQRRRQRLVEDDRARGLTLSAGGAWFVGNMVKSLTGRYLTSTLQA